MHMSAPSNIYKVRKVVLTILGICLIIFGATFSQKGQKSLQKSKIMHNWTPASCTILSDRIESTSDGYALYLSYRYTLNDMVFTSTRIKDDHRYIEKSLPELEVMQQRFKTGTITTCYHNPLLPSDSVLILPSLQKSQVDSILSIILPVIGMIIIMVPWFLRKLKHSQPSDK